MLYILILLHDYLYNYLFTDDVMQAPDVIISDLDSKFKVLPSEFSIEERLDSVAQQAVRTLSCNLCVILISTFDN